MNLRLFMETEYIKIKQAIDDIDVIDFLKQSDKLYLVSFISQFPLPIAIFDRNARFFGVNQKFSDIYESDALYLFDKLLNTFPLSFMLNLKKHCMLLISIRIMLNKYFMSKENSIFPISSRCVIKAIMLK